MKKAMKNAMKNLTLIAVIALGLTSLSANAAKPGKLIKKLDTDGDGAISLQEFQAKESKRIDRSRSV